MLPVPDEKVYQLKLAFVLILQGGWWLSLKFDICHLPLVTPYNPLRAISDDKRFL